ncbi:TIGR03862 family flavoprotein [Pelagibacterium xiamenense]|uniref:TIGR03862 family flavoprotein n=1 Tax=Pelagibacterium xiamenense TaxID=2901140 RepID=UPI001E4BDAF6|nr:TIGR03862 family flavoprotein [Pelagibacterium xiamenense]MCD7061131.1 TIGR03862 family flavoprotein [Pelagibacterium xiamenense]
MAQIAVIGGGPAGLMAAEVLSDAGHAVSVFEAMPTVARKFLMAGKSGLNITHADDHAAFISRFGAAADRMRPMLDAFTGADVRAWTERLGIETFVGSSGRVFPKAMKASPLLRAWLGRLDRQGVRVFVRHGWEGFDKTSLIFASPDGRQALSFDAVILALGGASWPRLGSDAAWVPWLTGRGVAVTPFRPANCGFETGWSTLFKEKFAGAPVKSVVATSDAGAVPGEFVISRHGIEGALVYAHAAALRDALDVHGAAALTLDLVPGRSVDRLAVDLARQPRKASFSNRMRKGAGLDAVKTALVRELVPDAPALAPDVLAARIKALDLPVTAPRPIAEAISSAGGVSWESVDDRLMLTALPGVFVCGEMLDWEAPTGGYLISGCLATGRAAARGAIDWLAGFVPR